MSATPARRALVVTDALGPNGSTDALPRRISGELQAMGWDVQTRYAGWLRASSALLRPRHAIDLVVLVGDGRVPKHGWFAASVARRHLTPLIVVERGDGVHRAPRRTSIAGLWFSDRLVSRRIPTTPTTPTVEPDTLDAMGLGPRTASRASTALVVAPLLIDDLPEVVAIHRQAFPESAMTLLGARVIDRYYRWQFIGDHPAPYGAGVWSSGRLIGYLFGGRRTDAVSGFSRRFMATIAVGAVTHPTGVRRLAGGPVMQVLRLMFRRRTTAPSDPMPVADDAAELARGQPSFGVLSLALLPSARGSGAAKLLVDDAEQVGRAQGLSQMHLTVDVDNARALRFYEREGWVRSIDPRGRWRGRMIRPITDAHRPATS